MEWILVELRIKSLIGRAWSWFIWQLVVTGATTQYCAPHVVIHTLTPTAFKLFSLYTSNTIWVGQHYFKTNINGLKEKTVKKLSKGKILKQIF